MHRFVSTRGSLCRISVGTRLYTNCARTVHERVVFSLLGLAFERKQIPRFVGNISS